MRGRMLPALLVLLPLLAAGCGDGKKNGQKSPEPKKKAADLEWQMRQVRLTEPCRSAAPAPAAPAPAADPQAAPAVSPPQSAPPAAAVPEAAAPTPPPAAPPRAEPASSSPGGESGAPADPAAPVEPPPAPAEDPAICVRFLATYPEFESGMQRTLLQRLNDAVKELATSPSFDERRAGSVDGTGRRLIGAWKTRMQEKRLFDKTAGPERWFDERKVEILYRDRHTISFKLTERLFTGGAHELATALYVSYSLDRVDRLSMADLFVEGSAKRLNELGEKKFRERRAIAPGRSLADAGFDFPGGYFRLSANFAVTAEGLVFRYNPYDVGPYALGETEVQLSTEELKDLIRSQGPLGYRDETPPAATPATAAPAPVTEPPATEPPATEPDPGGEEDIGGG